MGKFLLPWFGGAPAVWTTCLLAYQVLLLAGYAYAHLLAVRLGPAQEKLHGVLLAASLLLLLYLAYQWPSPITPGLELRPETDQPVRNILMILLASIGLPFFLLSTTGPLVQHWYSRGRAGASPYRLYAISNLGSLLGLVSYPLLVEPHLTLRWQGRMWTLGYVLFALGCVACAWTAERAPASMRRVEDPVPHHDRATGKPGAGELLLWFSLAACGSVLLMGTTSLITQDVASAPLLWVLPLVLYLLSFILSFESSRWYRRGIVHPLFAAGAVLATIGLFRQWSIEPEQQIYLYSACLFVSCLVCHGELGRRKPPAGQLTTFYLMVAAGGAGGGAFAALVAPVIFPAYWEFHAGLWLAAALLVVVLFRDRNSWLYQHAAWLPWVILLAALSLPEALVRADLARMDPPVIYWYRGLLAGIALLTLRAAVRTPRPRVVRFSWMQTLVVALLMLLGYALVRQAGLQPHNLVARSRNFYGALTVWENHAGNPLRHNYLLMHGRITHGLQMRDPAYQQKATAYYDVRSGVGAVLIYHPNRLTQPKPGSLRAGFVGLGVGTLAVYGLPGDYFRFYEINPAVIGYASGPNALFTYLRDTKAQAEIVPGDARLSLEREAARGQLQQFDILAVDAFTSDAIPVHLLTREAFELYLLHLRQPNGVLAVHVSNKTLDLEPVVARLADSLDLVAVQVNAKDRPPAVYESDWVLLTRSRSLFRTPEISSISQPVRRDRAIGLWTDEYSNILSVIR
jgi:spermidine synthase